MPSDYPAEIRSGVCEAKVMDILASGSFERGTSMRPQDPAWQLKYQKMPEGDFEMDLARAKGLAPFQAEVRMGDFAGRADTVDVMVSDMKALPEGEMVKLSIIGSGGAHALAFQKGRDGTFTFYDPNIGLFNHCTEDKLKEIFKTTYFSKDEDMSRVMGGGYNGYAITSYLNPPEHRDKTEQVAKKAQETERQKEEERSRTGTVALTHLTKGRPGPRRNVRPPAQQAATLAAPATTLASDSGSAPLENPQ